MNKIFTAIPAIALDLSAIGKDQVNKMQGFNFRGIDDVYKELHTKMSKHGVFSVPEVLESKREERTTKTGGVMTYTIAKIKYKFYADDGSCFEAVVIGEGADSGDKSSNKAMAIAHKYALTQVFSIPTSDNEEDPDKYSHEVVRKSTASLPVPHTPVNAVVKPAAGNSNSSPTSSRSPDFLQHANSFGAVEWHPGDKERDDVLFMLKEVQIPVEKLRQRLKAKYNKNVLAELTRAEYDELLLAITDGFLK